MKKVGKGMKKGLAGKGMKKATKVMEKVGEPLEAKKLLEKVGEPLEAKKLLEKVGEPLEKVGKELQKGLKKLNSMKFRKCQSKCLVESMKSTTPALYWKDCIAKCN